MSDVLVAGEAPLVAKEPKTWSFVLTYFIFCSFFHPFSCGKAVLFGKGVSRQVFLSPPKRYFYPTHTFSIYFSFASSLHFAYMFCSHAVLHQSKFCLSDTPTTKVLPYMKPRPKTFVCKKTRELFTFCGHFQMKKIAQYSK